MEVEPRAAWPQSIEHSLIAAILAYPQTLSELEGDLQPHQFVDRQMAATFGAMLRLDAQGTSISPTSVGFELRKTGQLDSDDEQFLHELWGSSGSAANAQWCADRIRRAWQLREAALACTSAAREFRKVDADLGTVVDALICKLQSVQDSSLPAGPRAMSADLDAVAARARAGAQSGAMRSGTSTGFARVDWWTSGLQPSNLIVLAALTGMGKTALATNIAANVARAGVGAVVVFSMEMGRLEMAARVSASEAGVDLRRLTGGDLSEHELRCLDQAEGRLLAVGRNLLLDVSGRVTAATMRAHLRRIARQQAIALVVVDYLQLCGTTERAESLYARTAMISADLKALAVDFDVPVLALSQLSREAARRGGEPKLADLRDSGTIEQDANVVIFIHREQGSTPNADTDASIIFAKSRNGPIGKCTMRWNPQSVRFEDSADAQPTQTRRSE